jgi:DNA mismatch repair protein MutS2
MNERLLHTLEFDKIREQLLSYASSTLGEEKVKQLVPSSSFEEVQRWQDETDEGVTILRLKGHMPLDGIYNVRPYVKRAQIGGMLHSIDLMEIGSTIQAARSVKNYIEGLIEEEHSLPCLHEVVQAIHPLPAVEQRIKRTVDENGEILDSASALLRQLRQQIRQTESRVREKLESMIRSSNAQKMLSDAIITIRNDRFVIPVKQEYRSHYGGIVHDQSSSGQTLFIEPEAIVSLNNQLREVRLKEQQEIERILIELSQLVGEHAEEILRMVDSLSKVDFIMAKARFARAMKASKPVLNDEGIIQLWKARHPLLPYEEAVPNDIELGKDFTTIVITGPNTGGKTVTLKTIGLCTLMAQAGLQIPAQDGSEIAVFQHVFADIGDEQSIEQSLSTFSSHMVNIVDILKQVDDQSLVLFDELGAGTDPQEGAALAISILDEVTQRGARVVATTHYPELKAYGYNRSGVMNASVEFDIDSLSPTYKLLIGVPGRSNAFEISKRLGLDTNIIERARNHVSIESNKVDKMIASLEESKRKADEEWKEINELLKEAEKIHKDLKQQMMEFYRRKDELYEEAEKKAEQIVEKAKEEAEAVIRDLRKLRLEKRADIKEHELIDARKRLKEAMPVLEKSKQTLEKKKNQRTLQPGDEVKVLSFDQKGTLLERVNEHEWQVQIGIMKMKVNESDLEFIKSKPAVETTPLATVKGKDYHVGLELDLRGERYEDALIQVEKYIDDALLAGYPRVSIIHGKGTGALRQGVHQYLKNHARVKGFRLGDAGEGGSGVTVVELK